MHSYRGCPRYTNGNTQDAPLPVPPLVGVRHGLVGLIVWELVDCGVDGERCVVGICVVVSVTGEVLTHTGSIQQKMVYSTVVRVLHWMCGLCYLGWLANEGIGLIYVIQTIYPSTHSIL